MASSASAAAPGSAAEEQPAPRPIADAELQLLSAYTGEADLEVLRQRVVVLWRRAISGDAPVYLCVRALMFLEPKIRSHPAYHKALQRVVDARAGSGPGGAPPLWVEVGAAVGTDVRALRVDGLRSEELAALDVPDSRHYWWVGAGAGGGAGWGTGCSNNRSTWGPSDPHASPPTRPYRDIGLDLYGDATQPPCAVLFGDITDDAELPPDAAPLAASADAPAAARWGSIAELVSAAHVASCTAVLHCLGREQVAALLRKVRPFTPCWRRLAVDERCGARAALAHGCRCRAPTHLQMALLLRPGGLLVGSCLGAATPQPWEAQYQAGHNRWLHSAESLAEALEAAGYEQVEVVPTRWRVRVGGPRALRVA